MTPWQEKYREYLASDYWKQYRAEFLAERKWCEYEGGCRHPATQVHHKQYYVFIAPGRKQTILEKERKYPHLMQALCASHHWRIHRDLAYQKSAQRIWDNVWDGVVRVIRWFW